MVIICNIIYQQMLLEGLLPSAPPETMIDDEEEFIENNRILEEDELEEME